MTVPEILIAILIIVGFSLAFVWAIKFQFISPLRKSNYQGKRQSRSEKVTGTKASNSQVSSHVVFTDDWLLASEAHDRIIQENRGKHPMVDPDTYPVSGEHPRLSRGRSPLLTDQNIVNAEWHYLDELPGDQKSLPG